MLVNATNKKQLVAKGRPALAVLTWLNEFEMDDGRKQRLGVELTGRAAADVQR